MNTFDILNIIKSENILTLPVLELRFPDIDFTQRKDFQTIKNVISTNKSVIINDMLNGKIKFNKELYDILIEDQQQGNNTINIRIV